MGNSISNILASEKQDNKVNNFDDLQKNQIIDYIQSIKTKKLVINTKFANGLKNIDLENRKLIPMCLELYEKIQKELPEYVTSHKRFRNNKVEFLPSDVLIIKELFVNSQENYIKLEKLQNLNNYKNVLTMKQIGLDDFNDAFKALTTSSDMLGLSKKILFHLSDYIKLRFINSFNEKFENSTTIDFNFGRATYIYKNKGDKKNINNYRRIISVPVIVNLIHKILIMQLDNYLKSNNLINNTIQKAGISGQKSPILQQIVKVKEIIKDVINTKSKAALMFLDIKDAFGSIDRKALFLILKKYNVDPNFIAYVDNFYSSFSFCTTIDKTRINNVEWSNGLIQGCSMSPLLFVTAMNYVLEHFHTTHTGTVGYNLKGIPISLCVYMDDIVLICKDVDSLSFSYKKITELLSLLGMSLNTQKTTIILPGYSEEEKKAVNIDNINVVDKFTYLGCIINSDSSVEDVFNNDYNKIHEWLLNLENRKDLENVQKVAQFTEFIQPEITRRMLKLYDLTLSYKIKLVTLIKTFLNKWDFDGELQIFPLLTTTLDIKKCEDEVLKNIDLTSYDKLNEQIVPDQNLFDISHYIYDKEVDFKYGENNMNELVDK